jgi:hypothetical protein
MKLKTLALGVALVLAAVLPAQAQRGGGGGGNWELLGENQVNLGNERDVIRLNHDENFYRNKAYRRLRFEADGGEVRMKSVRLVYLNGHAEDIDVSRTLKPGEEVDLDLRGERSYLRQIEMNYSGKIGLSLGGGGIRLNTATIRVLGENARGGPPPAPPVAGRPGGGGRGFDEIARERFNTRDDRVDIRVGRREGRFGQIRLSNVGRDAFNLEQVVVEYANGERQRVRLKERLEPGEQTRPIDLEGDQRVLRSVTINFEPRRRDVPAEIALLATERPGRGDGDGPRGGGYRPSNAAWKLLGQQAVGVRGDRDVIRVEQSGDFYRDRGLDKLHFVSENADVHLMSIRVVYQNGYGENIRVDRLIRAGAELSIDLPGHRSYLREIEVTQRKLPGQRGRALVSIYGEPASRRR